MHHCYFWVLLLYYIQFLINSNLTMKLIAQEAVYDQRGLGSIWILELDCPGFRLPVIWSWKNSKTALNFGLLRLSKCTTFYSYAKRVACTQFMKIQMGPLVDWFSFYEEQCSLGHMQIAEINGSRLLYSKEGRCRISFCSHRTMFFWPYAEINDSRFLYSKKGTYRTSFCSHQWTQ